MTTMNGYLRGEALKPDDPDPHSLQATANRVFRGEPEPPPPEGAVRPRLDNDLSSPEDTDAQDDVDQDEVEAGPPAFTGSFEAGVRGDTAAGSRTPNMNAWLRGEGGRRSPGGWTGGDLDAA